MRSILDKGLMSAQGLDAGDNDPSLAFLILANHYLLIRDQITGVEAEAINLRAINENRNYGRPVRVVVVESSKLRCTYFLVESRTNHEDLLYIISWEEDHMKLDRQIKQIAKEEDPFFEENHGGLEHQSKSKSSAKRNNNQV